MKKLTIFLSMLFSFVFIACENNLDESFGFKIGSWSQNIEYVKVTENAYTVNMSASIFFSAGKAKIKQAGFNIEQNGEFKRITCSVQNGGENEILLKETVELPYSVSNHVTPFIETAEGTYEGKTYKLEHKKSYFSPSVFDFKLIMRTPGKLNLEANIANISGTSFVGSPKITCGTLTVSPKFENGFISAEFALSDLASVANPSFTLEVSNSMGTTSRYLSYNINSETAKSTYSTDGLKTDCYRLCGIDWALGNLQCVDDVWKIADSQYSVIASSPCWKTEYFTYDYTKTGAVYSTCREKDPNSLDIQGDVERDVVAANVPGWVLPNYNQAYSLVNNASYQKGYVVVDGYRRYGILYYNGGESRYTSNERYVEFDAKELNNLGVFLPAMGISDSSFSDAVDSRYSEDVMYLTSYSEKDSYYFYDSYYFNGTVYRYSPYFLHNNSMKCFNVTRSGNDERFVPVRPVKASQ